jgi:hypothetical protein
MIVSDCSFLWCIDWLDSGCGGWNDGHGNRRYACKSMLDHVLHYLRYYSHVEKPYL